MYILIARKLPKPPSSKSSEEDTLPNPAISKPVIVVPSTTSNTSDNTNSHAIALPVSASSLPTTDLPMDIPKPAPRRAQTKGEKVGEEKDFGGGGGGEVEVERRRRACIEGKS